MTSKNDKEPTEDKDPKNKPPNPTPDPRERRPRQRPSLGRVVIFCTRENDDELVENVALIVKVHEEPGVVPGAAGVDLQVFYQNGETGRLKRVRESEGLEQGRWRWPSRVE